MEDQGKRLLLAVVLALGVVLLWNVIFPNEPAPTKKKTTPDGQLEAVAPSNESPVGLPLEGGVAPVAPAGPSEPPIVLDFPNVHVEFSSRNGVLSSYQLTEKKYAHDADKGQLVVDPKRGIFGVNFNKGSSVVIPQDSVWHGEQLADDLITYTYRDDKIEVVKTFRLHPDAYIIELEVMVKRVGPDVLTQALAISAVGAQAPGARLATNATCRLGGDLRARSAKSLREGDTRRMHGTVGWVGFNNPFLFTAMAPRDRDDSLSCFLHPVDAIPGGMQVDLVYPPQQLDKTVWKRAVVTFIGPKYVSKLEGANELTYAEYNNLTSFSPGFDASVDMGWFSFIAHPLLWLLTWFYGFTGNWGVAIILLTVVVKLATLYWTTKSMRSMKAMAALKPHMDELQKKYPDDRQRLQQEMMGLYKQHGVSPLAGCLPMLLQMPIWLALYKMLSSVGELYLSPFIPGWIDDLTATDPFYILPVVLMGMMFLQSKMSPASLDSMQQKILMYGLPLMFGVMSFFFPSGLTVYILTNTSLSLLHTLYMKKYDRSAKTPLPPIKVTAPPAESAPPRGRKGRPAPKVIDVEAEEQEALDAEDEDAEEEDADEVAPPAARKGTPSAGPKTNTPRRKRKRGKH